MNPNQTNNYILTLDQDSKDNPHSKFVLPRQGWQDKQVFLKAVIKAKRALDIAEISKLLD